MLPLRILTLLVLAVALVPREIPAEETYYLTPSFSLSEEYNDNILFSPDDTEHDFITHFTPGILGGYESPTTSLLAGYNFDAQVFARFSELNDATARQNGFVEGRHLVTPRLALAGRGEYIETHDPGQLNIFAGIPGGRVRSTRFLIDPSVSYSFDARSRGTFNYTFTKDSASGGVTTDIHRVAPVLTRRITPLDTLSLGYTFRLFRFSEGGSTDSHSIVPAWAREITPRLRVLLGVGPRITEGTVDADILTTIAYDLPRGSISFNYVRALTAVVGEFGVVNSDSVFFRLVYQPVDPLELGFAPSFYRAKRGTSEAKVYEVRLDATYDITHWLSVFTSYAYTFQDGLLGTADSSDNISRNRVFLGLDISYPVRLQ